MRHRWATFLLLGALASCGNPGRAEPITEMQARDLRAEQSRERSPGEVLGPMLASTKPDRVIYGPPPDLTLQTEDTVPTAPFGITPAADSAARPGARDTTARPDSAR